MDVPTTKEALGEHLYAVVKPICPSDADKVTGILLECDTQDILNMLQNNALLMKRVGRTLKLLGKEENTHLEVPSQQKQELGEDLFEEVSKIETNLCSQITGMLLELDQSILKQLLHCPQELEKAVNKAKSEYLQQSGIDHLSHSTTEQNCNQTKEELGEMIYELVNEKHPLEAAKITGMLLEMPVTKLEELLQDSAKLDQSIRIAEKALQQS